MNAVDYFFHDWNVWRYQVATREVMHAHLKKTGRYPSALLCGSEAIKYATFGFTYLDESMEPDEIRVPEFTTYVTSTKVRPCPTCGMDFSELEKIATLVHRAAPDQIKGLSFKQAPLAQERP